MELTPISQKFVLHWGEMGSRWGVNRTVSQIHALLYITGKPMHAEEIAETLGVARSNVSTSLKELQNWKLVKVAHIMGDRRDHFETSLDIWELFRTIVRERKTRELDPTIGTLRECLGSPELAQEDKAAQQRIAETLALMETLTSWTDEMLRLEPATLMKLLKMGATVQKFVRGDNRSGSKSEE
ncbi:DNA-binding transcriptional regulator GbsR (MarR family) [Paucimonas lemoignei]|uniref:HTH-type transcriptional regulator n=1 Tax=Paucimonas lemoignei TaxID=29443 RepID=A0A4R3HZ54_PAULE|nr:MarR family transcriptional regulator [Paucimonas lemoignei]TCS38677.1 DNA-binding transcriptional regulator GbsR (MarR family) [Paucimonas lemoignei]